MIHLRFFTVYGERQRPDLAISKFVKNIIEGKEITSMEREIPIEIIHMLLILYRE